MGVDERAGIDIRIEQYGGLAVISVPDLDPVELHLKDPARLRVIVRKYARQVEKARPLGLPVHEGAAQEFLRQVKNAGNGCLREATGDSYDTLGKAYDLLYKAMAKAVLRSAPLNVQITDHVGEYFPWEWLGRRDRTNYYISEARTTLGLAAIVCRRVTISEADQPGDQKRSVSGTAADILNARPRLPVRFFRNPELDRTRVERRFFKYNDDIELTGLFPESAPDGKLALADQLVDPAYQIAGFPHRHPDQVVHMSCHHEVEGNPETATAYELLASESKLSFGSKSDPGREISIAKLGDELADPENRHAITSVMPLIFFNACRGNFYPFTTESAVQVLLRNGNRGMISTAVRVPDNAAAELSQFFYERLLDGDCTAAEALLYAKWKLIHNRACPLGILYSYYGRPDLHILPARHVHAKDPIITLWNGGKS